MEHQLFSQSLTQKCPSSMKKSELIQDLNATVDSSSDDVSTIEIWDQCDNYQKLLKLKKLAFNKKHSIKESCVIIPKISAEAISKYTISHRRTTHKFRTPAQKKKSDATELLQQIEWFQLLEDAVHKAQTSSVARTLCQLINRALKSNEEVLITRFGLQITKNEIQLLSWRNPRWLNDNIINFYMELIANRSQNNPTLPKIYAMNTFFLKKLIQSGYEAVKSWTKRLQPDIFTYDQIIIPVHSNNHWRLSIVYVQEKIIEHYDSLGSDGRDVLPHIENYIQLEYNDKRKTKMNIEQWKKKMTTKPRQTNGIDCGVFVCTYADLIATNIRTDFKQKDISHYRQKIMCEIMSGKFHI